MGFLVVACGSSLTSADIQMVEPTKVRDNFDKLPGSVDDQTLIHNAQRSSMTRDNTFVAIAQ